MFNALYTGIFLVMLCYNLFLSLGTKEKSYLYYVWTLLFMLLFQLSMFGYAYEYFWPHLPAFNNVGTVLFGSIGQVFSLLFAYHFLQVKTFIPAFKKYIFLLIGLLLGNAMLGFASIWRPQHFLLISKQVILFGALFLAPIFIGLSYFCFKKGFKPARFYLLAWSVFMCCVVAYVFTLLRVIPTNDFTEKLMEVGPILEIVLMAFSLADKMNVVEKEKNTTQLALIQQLETTKSIQEENKRTLEQKVLDRTKTIQ